VSAPRVAVRAVIVVEGRVLLVNAYPGEASDLWVPPGGGAETGTSLRANLEREVREETGLAVRPGRLADPEGVVNRLRWGSVAELAGLRVKPGILARVAFGRSRGLVHEDLDVMVP
jgi:ADP-ribose pyrophosphatase YjhB (NUDIX family)